MCYNIRQYILCVIIIVQYIIPKGYYCFTGTNLADFENSGFSAY